jgi:hypothetical protein
LDLITSAGEKTDCIGRAKRIVKVCPAGDASGSFD